MNFKSLTAFVLVGSFAISTWAIEDSEIKLTHKAHREDHELFADSSEANRLGKKWTIQLASPDTSTSLISGSGIAAGMFLDRNTQVIVDIKKGTALTDYSRFEWNLMDGYSAHFKPTPQYTQVAVNYKRFLGNSYYLRAGGAYSSMDYTFDLTGSQFAEDRWVSSFSSQALLLVAGIGNQWQWENITFGCDWIGVATPVIYQIHRETPPPSKATEYVKKFEKDEKTYVRNSSISLLRLYLGASF